MRNTILIIIEMIVCYISLFYLSKKYKLFGVYIYGILNTIAACIASLKSISIMEVSIPIGYSLTTSLVITGNLITENYKKEDLKNYIAVIFLTGIISATFLNLSGLMTSSDFNYYANESYNNIFNYNIRIYVALIISIIMSIIISNKLYTLIRRSQNRVIASNIFSIIISTFIETIIYVTITYLFEFNIIDIVLCIIFRYIIKIIIGIIGTIPLCMIKKYNE